MSDDNVSGGVAPKPKLRGASFLIPRTEFARRLNGDTYDGKRNVAEALGYQPDLTSSDYRKRYQRNPVAARVVEAGPKGTWRGGVEVVETDSLDKFTDFEKAMDALATRLNLWRVFMKADILAGLGRYACILIGAPGPLDVPLKKMKGPDDIVYLQPYPEDEMQVLTYDDDDKSPRFGSPLQYQLQIDQAASGRSRPRPTLTKPVHWTRVIHYADNTLNDNVFGMPRLERVWDKLDDLDKVTGGGAEAFWQNANRGIQFDVDPEIAVDPEEKEALEQQADMFMHGQRRSMRTRGVKINPLGTDTAEFASNAMAILQQISSGSGIPLRILIGAESGELASTQDRSNWNDRVSDRRVESSEPLVRQLVDRFIEFNVVPTPKTYKVNWPRPEDMTEMERVEAAASMAQANKDQFEATGVPIMTTDEIRDRFLRSAPLPDKVVKEFEQREKDAQQAEIDAQAARAKPPAKPAAKRAAAALQHIDTEELDKVLSRDALDKAQGIIAEALAEAGE